MAKLILTEEPGFSWDRCPFMEGSSKCMKTSETCACVGGYYDYIDFDFDKCPYCTTLEKALEELNYKSSDEERED